MALEGMMLIGCLTAVHRLGLCALVRRGRCRASASARCSACVMAFFAYQLKADIILVGFAINILAAGGTVFALALATGGDKGTSINLPSQGRPGAWT